MIQILISHILNLIYNKQMINVIIWISMNLAEQSYLLITDLNCCFGCKQVNCINPIL